MKHYDVGFLGHLETPQHYVDFLTNLNPDLEKRTRSRDQLIDLLASMRPTPISEIEMRSANGTIKAGLYTDLFILVYENLRRKEAIGRVIRGCSILSEAGCKVTALGGFASIIAEAGSISSKYQFSSALTTGNTLTAAAIAHQAMTVAAPSDLITIVGGGGDVGSGIARMLNGRGYRVALVGRSPVKVKRIADELDGCRVGEWATLAPHTDVAILISSTHLGGINLSAMQPGSWVLDGGHPRNALPTRTLRYASAGRVTHFHKVETEIPEIIALFCEHNETHACLGEAIILGYEEMWIPFSKGSGNIKADAMHLILELGEKHGVLPSTVTPVHAEYESREADNLRH